MRASRHRGSACNAASTSPMTGASRNAGASGRWLFPQARRQRLRVRPAAGGHAARPENPPPAPGTPRGWTRDPRIDQHHPGRGQRRGRGKHLAYAGHQRGAACDADRDIGAKPGGERSSPPPSRHRSPSTATADAAPPRHRLNRRRCRTRPAGSSPAPAARPPARRRPPPAPAPPAAPGCRPRRPGRRRTARSPPATARPPARPSAGRPSPANTTRLSSRW